MAALQAALLLRLPGGRADIVTAQGIGVQVIQLLLTLFRRCGPELFTALLLLRRRVLDVRFCLFRCCCCTALFFTAGVAS